MKWKQLGLELIAHSKPLISRSGARELLFCQAFASENKKRVSGSGSNAIPRGFSTIPEKRPRLDAERFGNAGDVVDRNIALGPLDRVEIRAVDAALVAESLLTEPALGAEPAHVFRQNVAQGSFVRPLHRSGSCPLTFLRRPLLSYIMQWREKACASVQRSPNPGNTRRLRGGRTRLTEDPRATLLASFPGVLPDNRVVSGQCVYAEALSELTRDAAFIRGIVAALDRDGVGVLRRTTARPELKYLLLFVAVYGGSRTWDDVLTELLGIQNSSPDHVQIRLLARRVGADRPANLPWIQPSGGGHGGVIAGNVGNLLATESWDPTDAVLAMPLEPAAAEALRKWFDNAQARSSPLTKETATAPRLRPHEGDAEGERMWREYLELLDGHSRGISGDVNVDPETGEVLHAGEQTLSEVEIFPRPDPVLLAAQTALAKGSVVAMDQSSRAPPLSAPVKAEFFGERGETRSGAARRLQRFSVSLFNEETARRLGRQRAAMSGRLAACRLIYAMAFGGCRTSPMVS